jgi:hypothetical protein
MTGLSGDRCRSLGKDGRDLNGVKRGGFTRPDEREMSWEESSSRTTRENLVKEEDAGSIMNERPLLDKTHTQSEGRMGGGGMYSNASASQRR